MQRPMRPAGDELRRVSSADSQVVVWVVTAQEDRTIAVHVSQMESTGGIMSNVETLSRGGSFRAADRR